MDMAARVQIMGKTVCISHSANILENAIIPVILSAANGKIAGQTETFNLDMTNSQEEGKLCVQNC